MRHRERGSRLPVVGVHIDQQTLTEDETRGRAAREAPLLQLMVFAFLLLHAATGFPAMLRKKAHSSQGASIPACGSGIWEHPGPAQLCHGGFETGGNGQQLALPHAGGGWIL